MIDEIRILYPDQIYPEKISGGYLRTINLAKLYSEFTKTSLFGISNDIEYQNKRDDISFYQEKKYQNTFGKIMHFSSGLFSQNYSLMKSNKAFYNADPEKTIFHIEGPLVYNLLKKHDIKNYILDEQNIYWEFSEFPTFDIKNRIYHKIASKRDKKLEIESIKNATYILACSERDRKIMVQEVPEAEEKISIVPNCVNFDSYKNCPNKTNKNSFNVLFIGSMVYQPNTDALYSICKEIAPNFEENVQFDIIGGNSPKIDHPNNVKIRGYVEDVKNYVSNSDICIAPLRYGSGTRLKILEYMASGKPVISTSKGAEGIDYTQNENIIIEDDITKFAIIISKLLEDKKRRNKLGKNARDLIKCKYDWKIYKKKLCNVYEEVLNAN